MHRDAVSGHWDQMRCEVKQRFQQLSEHELDDVDGDRAKLERLLETRYGLARPEAQRILDEILSRLPANGRSPAVPVADGLRRRRRNPSIVERAGAAREDEREPEWRPGEPEGSGRAEGDGREQGEPVRTPEKGEAPRLPEKEPDPEPALTGRSARAVR